MVFGSGRFLNRKLCLAYGFTESIMVRGPNCRKVPGLVLWRTVRLEGVGKPTTGGVYTTMRFGHNILPGP